MPLVTLSSDGHVRTLTLNDPDKLNALSWPLLEDFASAVGTVAQDSEARALVVTGAGRAFCSGADLKSLFGDLDRPVDVLERLLRDVYASFLSLRDLTIPTVAAVHGPAVGAGMNIALACDVIVVGATASFVPSFSRIGLQPGGGCHWLLTQRVGAANATAALFAGDALDAPRAIQLGIAQEATDDPQGRSHELAADYAQREPTVMADIKRLVRLAASTGLESTLAEEARAQAHSLKSETFRAFARRFTD
jgi:enoyl-CoA hydratase